MGQQYLGEQINNQQHLSTTSSSQQHQLQQQTQPLAQTQLQQQQYLATCSTMPAMSKDKTATAVSLNESNFSELKIKELTVSSSSATTTISTSTQPSLAITTKPAASTMAATSRLPHHHQMQQQHHQNRSTCGCGATSYTEMDNGQLQNLSCNNSISGSTRYLTNGHTSPLAAAVAAAQNSPTTTMQHRNSNSRSCCRSNNMRLQQNGSLEEQQQQQQLQQKTRASISNAANTTTQTATLPRRTPNDYIFGRFIGEGSFSNVYLAVDIATKREYAIKVCEKRHILREHKQEYVRREREVMHMLAGAPGFVNLSCTFQDDRNLYFVMTYAKNGDLLPCINKVGSFDVDCTRHYAAELVLACEQMHRRNIIHRDLKPENILLDEDMHTLIADFGSAKIMTTEERAYASAALAADTNSMAFTATTPSTTPSYFNNSTNNSDSTRRQSRTYARSTVRSSDDDDDDDDDDTGTGSDELDSPSRRQPRYTRRRRGSFVGTAQYVSPEVLQNGPITPSADLWALGCIIYQMISGLPPFRGSNEYVIFKEILACNLDFPQGFDPDAEDLVRNLLKIIPGQRLGARDENDCYTSIRAHPFFNGVDFNKLSAQTPPPINPYLPGVSTEHDFPVKFRVPDNLENLEPGLDDRQMNRLLGLELGCGFGAISSNNYNENKLNCEDADVVDSAAVGAIKENNKTAATNSFDLSAEEKMLRLEQQKSDKWHAFADNEVILKKGYVNKRKGLFARKRMLLLTTGPRLIYIDPVQMIKKGEIPWSSDLRVEAKNFKIFFVITPNRTYYLDDPEGFALQWVDAVEKLRLLTYPELMNQTDSTSKVTTTPTTYIVTSTTITPPVPTQTSTMTAPAVAAAATTVSPSLATTSTIAATPRRSLKTASN